MEPRTKEKRKAKDRSNSSRLPRQVRRQRPTKNIEMDRGTMEDLYEKEAWRILAI